MRMKLWKSKICCGKKSNKVIEPVQLPTVVCPPWLAPGPPPKYETTSECDSFTTLEDEINANEKSNGIADIKAPALTIVDSPQLVEEQHQGLLSILRFTANEFVFA